jgi:hypothetical protein
MNGYADLLARYEKALELGDFELAGELASELLEFERRPSDQ